MDYNSNNLLGDSILNSKYFNPAYLSDQVFFYIKKFVAIMMSDQGITVMKGILFVLASFFLTVIAYVIVRMLEIRAKEHRHIHHEIEEYAHNKREYEKKLREAVGGSKNERWSKTLNYLFSQHASDWKLAIIEADSILSDLLEHLGFHGESLGERLKMANQENFPKLTIAWEVHTIRNKIAHEGLNFELTQHEAKRVIALYEEIFHTYGFI